MDNMLLEKYASILQKQAGMKILQECGMEKQAFGILGKGLNLAARGAGKGLKLGANALQRGSQAMQRGIGRAGNWAQHAGAAADKAIAGGLRTAGTAAARGLRAAGGAAVRGANSAWRGINSLASNPLMRGVASSIVPGYALYELSNIRKMMQENQFQQPSQPAQPTPNFSDQVGQWGGTMGNMPVQQPTLQQGLTSSFNYNPAGQFNPYGM